MLLKIKVKTKQKSSSLKYIDDQYIAHVKSLPAKNQANFELLDLVAEYFKVAKNKVTIKSGKKSQLKTILIDL